MGIVYSAYDDVMERPVAIKVMMADLQDDPETSTRFYREAHAAGQLVHHNIITIFDMGDDDGRPYIVMELLEGLTLGDYLKRPEGVLLEDKIALMMQVCTGLQLAHAKGIFHRDIKPGNLLVRNDGNLKIVDFGIARLATSSMTVSGLIVGTPDYMSPEQACGREVDQRSDIFSSGAVFYYMLTGRKPFGAGDLPAVLAKVQYDDPLPIRDSEAPPVLVTVVMKALAKSPTARYQHVGEMMADLNRVAMEVALETRRAGEQVRLQLGAIDALASDRRKRCHELGVTAGPTDVDQVHEQIQQRYPTLGEWLDGRACEPLRHAAAYDLLAEVTAIRQLLDDEVAVLLQGASELRSGASAASDGNLTQALNHFDSAFKAMPTCRRARDEGNRIRSLLAQKQAAKDHARALLIEAQGAAARAEWPAVLELTTEALAADGANVEAVALRDQASNALSSETRQRKMRCERALDRAEKLARKRLYAEAEEALGEARSFDPDSPTVPLAEKRIRTARLDAERASEAERRAAEAIAAARITFDSGARAQALAELREFLAREPQALGVSAALVKLTAEADRLLADERRRAEAADQAKAAEIALQGDDPDRALSLARQALGLDSGEPLARKIQGIATARLRERTLAQERKEKTERMLQTARTLLGRGKYGAARELARSAANLSPSDGEPLALLAEIDGQESTAREAEQRERDARTRAKAAAPVLAMAKAAELNQDFARAGWLAENALALDLDCAEARQIIESVRARLSAQPHLAEDTVKIAEDGGRAPDSDDTLTLSPVAPMWRRLVSALTNWWQATRALLIKRRAAGDPIVKESGSGASD
jgi:hypothetical protein